MTQKLTTYFWLAALALLSAPVAVFAQPQQGPTGGGSGDITLQDPLRGADIENILERIIDFLLVIAAPIAIIMTIYAGYLFMTAADNEDKVKKARTTLLYVVIGVAVLILSKGIISLVKSFL